MLRDRQEAGQKLAAELQGYRGCPGGLVLAIPRGGVVVGLQISLALQLPLDVLITRKIGAPDNPELAVAALSETGSLHVNHELLSFFPSSAAFEEERRRQHEEIVRRQDRYRPGRSLPQLAGRTVILVDDGIATGATYFASIHALKAAHVARLIAALPLAPPDTADKIRRQVDECVILESPWPFYAVGEHYLDFSQVDDDEVIRSLQEASGSK
jgi:putative phosphoribosyl transferase